MGDAEDVLLAAAERIGAAHRSWRRPVDERDGASFAAAERRVATWLAALGCAPLAPRPCETPSPPGWLARVLGQAAPWQTRPRAIAWSDGRRLFLPAEALRGERGDEAEFVLLAALALGRRAAGPPQDLPACSAVERDVAFAIDAAQGDAELAAALPGLAPAIERARIRALSTRPALERLRPAERVVEVLVRALLARPLHANDRGPSSARVSPIRVDAPCADWVRLAALPGGYRGVAPVEHWGAPLRMESLVTSAAPGGSKRTGRRAPTRALRRPVLRRALEPGEDAARTGPFVLPHGDPHLAVQDARGVARPQDQGEEDLDALADELGRVGALPTVRSEGEIREVLESGARPAGGGATARFDSHTQRAERVFLYPEWDAARNAYRDPGVVLRERTLPSAMGAATHGERAALLARLRRHFEALRPRRERVGRQLDGEHVDVDGVVAEHGDRIAGRAPEGRLYAREQPRRRDVAVALLVDASGSTDAWVSRRSRVIDVARDAALCLGEALGALGDRHAILAFSGQGPGDVRVGVAKRFSEPWSETVRARLAGLEPDRSTRLGGPIRHAAAMLARQPARARLLLVLSDGKPDDDDVYEGAYGVADVRQAVFEARRAGVRPFCVTIDRAGPAYLPELFGPHGYTVLWDVEQLPERLPAIYRRLAGL